MAARKKKTDEAPRPRKKRGAKTDVEETGPQHLQSYPLPELRHPSRPPRNR